MYPLKHHQWGLDWTLGCYSVEKMEAVLQLRGYIISEGARAWNYRKTGWDKNPQDKRVACYNWKRVVHSREDEKCEFFLELNKGK